MPSQEIVVRTVYRRRRKRVFVPRDVGRIARALIDQRPTSDYVDWDTQDICDELRRRGIDCCKGKDKCSEAALQLASILVPMLGTLLAAIIALTPAGRGLKILSKVLGRIPGAATAVLGILSAVEKVARSVGQVDQVIRLAKTVVECYRQDKQGRG